MTSLSSLTLVVIRFIEFTASLLLFGAVGFRSYFRYGFAGAPGLQDEFEDWLETLLLVAVVTTLAFSLAWLDMEAVMMGNGWADALDAQTVSAVLFRTVFGRAWSWHIAFGAGVLAVLLLARRRVRNQRKNVLLLSLSAAVVASTAWAGHAVMGSGSIGRLQLSVQVIHLLVASAWLGSLPILGYVIYRAKSDPGHGWVAVAQYILPRYSRAGYVAVGLVLLTGCANSWFLVGSVHALVTTNYGHVLIAKVCLVVLMVGVAVINRVVHLPAVMRLDHGVAGTGTPLSALWQTVALEQGLALAILAAVAVLGTLAPARGLGLT